MNYIKDTDNTSIADAMSTQEDATGKVKPYGPMTNTTILNVQDVRMAMRLASQQDSLLCTNTSDLGEITLSDSHGSIHRRLAMANLYDTMLQHHLVDGIDSTMTQNDMALIRKHLSVFYVGSKPYLHILDNLIDLMDKYLSEGCL